MALTCPRCKREFDYKHELESHLKKKERCSAAVQLSFGPRAAPAANAAAILAAAALDAAPPDDAPLEAAAADAAPPEAVLADAMPPWAALEHSQQIALDFVPAQAAATGNVFLDGGAAAELDDVLIIAAPPPVAPPAAAHCPGIDFTSYFKQPLARQCGLAQLSALNWGVLRMDRT